MADRSTQMGDRPHWQTIDTASGSSFHWHSSDVTQYFN